MKIFIVMEIDYDWHTIIGAYSNEEDAIRVKEQAELKDQECVEKFGCDKNEFIIEEVELL